MSKKQVAIVVAVLTTCVAVLVGVIAVRAVLSRDVVSGKPTQAQLLQASPASEAFADATDVFAYKTASKVLSRAVGNINYSPLSLYYALAITASGASGDTLQSLLDVLEVPSLEMLQEQGNNRYLYLYEDYKHSALKLANSIWVNSRYSVEEDFAQSAAEDFYASTYNVKFGTAAADKKMSQWVQQQTHGAIMPAIRTHKEQAIAIYNTLYFLAEWQDEFLERMTEVSDFYLADGTAQEHDFMRCTDEKSTYYRGEGFVRAARKLKNGNSMVFILPDEGTTTRQLVATPELAQLVLEGGEERKADVVWQLPKFSFSSSFGLIEPLKELGLSTAFSSNADFSAMAAGGVFIDEVTQMSHIAVDENGVAAAAFTTVTMSAAAIPEQLEWFEMTLNRPFIYGIKAVDGTLLFIGICDNPVQ